MSMELSRRIFGGCDGVILIGKNFTWRNFSDFPWRWEANFLALSEKR